MCWHNANGLYSKLLLAKWPVTNWTHLEHNGKKTTRLRGPRVESPHFAVEILNFAVFRWCQEIIHYMGALAFHVMAVPLGSRRSLYHACRPRIARSAGAWGCPCLTTRTNCLQLSRRKQSVRGGKNGVLCGAYLGHPWCDTTRTLSCIHRSCELFCSGFRPLAGHNTFCCAYGKGKH